MFNIILYSLMSICLGISYVKNPGKSKKALKIAWKSFIGIMPMMLGIIGLIGIMLTFISPTTIKLAFNDSWWSTVVAALVGAITLLPAVTAFPLAASLIREGAGIMPIAAFVTTLTMVGFVTLPMEIKFIGRRYTLWRNALSFVAAVIIGVIMGIVLA